MNNESKLATIRKLNHRQELPFQERDSTIFNGALFDLATLAESILLPPYNFTHPLSDYSPTEFPTLIREYGINAGRLNSPKTVHTLSVFWISHPPTTNMSPSSLAKPTVPDYGVLFSARSSYINLFLFVQPISSLHP
jgi:hypothetical protein